MTYDWRWTPVHPKGLWMLDQSYHPRRTWRKTINGGAGVVAVAFVALLCVATAWAHHGLAAFDTTRTVILEGTITDFQFINPHVFIFADIKNDKGKAVNWRLELGSPGMLSKYGGWNNATVKRGDHIRIQGFLAKDGSPYFSVGRIWLPDGRSLEGKP